MKDRKDAVKRSVTVDDVRVPTFVYGTAWKEDETQRLTALALEAGFQGIDTANQRRHYVEASVGEALAAAFGEGSLVREALFLQTKFTYVQGQDHRLPYDPEADTATQVRQSFASSLEHLHTDYLDAYLLHGPSLREGLTPRDWEAWKAMEELHDAGKAKLLGIANVGLDQLEALCAEASTAPTIVQNRCYARLGWDRDVRCFCRARGIVYQAFSLLTANRDALARDTFQQIVGRTETTPAQVVFRFALQVGMTPLTGTSRAEHMRQDLESYDFALSEEDLATIENLAV